MAIDTTQIARKAGLPAELAQNPHVVAALRLALFEGQQAVTGLAARHAQLQQAAADVLAQLSLVERDGRASRDLLVVGQAAKLFAGGASWS